MKWSIVSASVLLAMSMERIAFADTCDRCNANAACQTFCRLICEEKRIEVTCWSYQQDDFCVPGPSKPGCQHCEATGVAGPDGTEAPCLTAPGKKFAWTDWIPGWAEVHTRRKLVKQTVTKTIPSTTWVVEKLCADCVSKPVPSVGAATPSAPPSTR